MCRNGFQTTSAQGRAFRCKNRNAFLVTAAPESARNENIYSRRIDRLRLLQFFVFSLSLFYRTVGHYYKKTMNFTAQIAKHLRDVHFGGNWTSSSLKEQLEGITWQQATTKVYSFNTIAALVYHVNYFVSAVLKVMEGGPLDAKDKYSFDHPPILSAKDWEELKEKVWADAECFAALIEQFPDAGLGDDFVDGKYGNYYRNIHGIIEHMHYHLGQIALIKIILQADPQPQAHEAIS